MKKFVNLYIKLEECEGLTQKLRSIVGYLRNAGEEDAVTTIWLLNANKPKQIIGTSTLKKWILYRTGIPEWLYEECQSVVKDPELTLSLIVEPGSFTTALSFSEWIKENIEPLKSMDAIDQQEFVIQRFLIFSQKDRLIFLKLLSGKLKLCADKKTVIQALSTFSKLDEDIITYRLSRLDLTDQGCFEKLFRLNDLEISNCRPYPFMPAVQLDDLTKMNFLPQSWAAEWKWKGIRVQVIKRNQKVYIWSRTHEFLSDKFPDLVDDLTKLPDDIILDGHLISEEDQEGVYKRISGRLTGTVIQKYPVKFIVFDILVCGSLDLREQVLCERKNHLSRVLNSYSFECLKQADCFQFSSFDELNKLQTMVNYKLAEGLLVKDFQSIYNPERSSSWYSLKKERSTIKATLLYIQRDYQNYEAGVNTISIMTFGVPDGNNFVSIAKTGCNLSVDDIIELEKYIKENTIERVGPIRVLKPGLIFELSFDEIISSKRHKSGLNIISPQLCEWNKTLTLDDIHSLAFLRNSIVE